MAHLSRELCLDSLSAAARALAEADRDSASAAGAEAVLRERVPWLSAQIEADRDSLRFDRWGSSTVVDENVGLPVIPDAAFRALHRAAGLPSVAPIGNAGLLHVYGYLLSAVETPYGLKRDRWTEGGVARAFGLPPAAFAPWFDGPSTPLGRVLDAALPLLEAPRRADRLRLWVDEWQTPDEGLGLVRTLVLQHPESGSGALLYGIQREDEPIRLVTVFPVEAVTEAWLDDLLAIQPRLRFNAVLDGGAAGSPLGSRQVHERS